MTGIEWTEATWNPATGCTEISSGCKYCYARKMAERLKAMGKPKYANGFEYTEHPDAINIPRKWKKPRRIFVNSMSDMFYERATMPFLDKCFEVMMEANWHTYQILTKRTKIMATYSQLFEARYHHRIPKHIWMGTSVENIGTKTRLDVLRNVRCAVRFVSFEPLLGRLGTLDLDGIHWAIIGGESGVHHRPVKKDWILDIIQQCEEQNVPVFFKQWGGIRPKSGGRMIDGRTYDEYPNHSTGVF